MLFYPPIRSLVESHWSQHLSLTKILKKTSEYVENVYDKYTSVTYPPLTKTATMTLARSLVEYLAHNYNYLRNFSALETSLGVWLSSIETKRHQDSFWNLQNCPNITNLGRDASHLGCSSLEPQQMLKIWKKQNKILNFN